MSKKLFKSLKNIHTSDIIIAGTTIVPEATLYIFMNPTYFINNMGDIVSEYTQGHLTIYDNIGYTIADGDVWDSISYNLDAVAHIDVSDIYLYINETTELNGYEFNIICNPIAPITVNLPLIIQSVKKVTIKNTSTYQITVHPNASDTIDNASSDILLNLNDIVILNPIYETNKWINISTGGGAVTHTINNTNTATINSTDYLIRYTGTANITYNLPTATGSNRFLRFVHAGSVNTSIIVDASTNTSTLNNDTGITITKYDIGDILAIEVCDAATGKWELC